MLGAAGPLFCFCHLQTHTSNVSPAASELHTKTEHEVCLHILLYGGQTPGKRVHCGEHIRCCIGATHQKEHGL